MPPKISDSTAGEKLLALYTLLMLQGTNHISLASLADALACSKQTVLRLLNQLEASGYGKLDFPIRRGRESFYRLSPVKTELLDLGAKELAELALCRQMLSRLFPESSLLADKQAIDLNNAQTVSANILYKGFIDYALYEEQHRTLLTAIQKRIVCKVEYQKSVFNKPREFFFAPMRMVIYRETLAVVGWEVTEKGLAKCLYSNWLWLYLQRFASVAPTRRSSENLPDIRLKTGEKAEFGIMMGEPFRVSLLFNTAAANYVYDRKWAADQVMKLTDDKGLILEMTVCSEPEIISWILSFGASVKVLEPAWLREKIISKALEITANSSAQQG